MRSFPEASIIDAEELVEDCKNGTLAAFEHLYEVHGARMKSVAFNLLGNVQDAEDAVQDAFLKIYRSVGSFRRRSSFTTWIYRVLVNACYDLMRTRRRREPEVPERAPGLGAVDKTTGGCADHPLRLTLERSLRNLSERQRTVFLLFEVEGFRHREIAEILSIAEGTSKCILFEAKQELQQLIRAGSETGI